MSTPVRYRLPQPVYAPRVERLTVSGFSRTEFFQTGASSGYVGGGGVYGASGGWQGEYHQITDAPAFRHLLENTRCVRQVDEAGDAPLRIEGEVYTERHLGPVRTAVRVVELCTLLPFLGLPFPGAIDGWGTARLYRDAVFLNTVSVSTRLSYWTTAWSAGGPLHKQARGMTLRDLADEVAADLCRE